MWSSADWARGLLFWMWFKNLTLIFSFQELSCGLQSTQDWRLCSFFCLAILSSNYDILASSLGVNSLNLEANLYISGSNPELQIKYLKVKSLQNVAGAMLNHSLCYKIKYLTITDNLIEQWGAYNGPWRIERIFEYRYIRKSFHPWFWAKNTAFNVDWHAIIFEIMKKHNKSQYIAK